MSHRARLGCALAAVVAVASCAAPANAPSAGQAAVTVSSCGQQLRFEHSPQRAVTLEQSSTETLLALGLGERMAGTAYRAGRILPEYQAAYDKIPVLNPKALSGEQLRAAAPDLVVSSFASNFTKDKAGTRAELQALGLPSYVSAVDCPEHEPGLTPFERLFRDYENYGKVFGVADRAAALTAKQREVVQQAGAVRAGRPGKPTVVYVYSVFKGLPYVAGHNGMPSDMSRILNAPNAFDDINEEWPEMSWEEIAKRDPTVIVVGDLSDRGAPGDSAAEKLKMMREHPVVSQLTAVRQNRIIEVPGIELDPTVRSANTLRLLGEGLKALGV
ncbi:MULTISPECIES: ABC transporter substrate-binding protein [unclassified Crossiella]|uniref:ABC transporter substrate-binding protein n=1 Tax=unclassified Crossiella TaxID=2620835 RepID=UPI001FFE6EE9|nr:MULTISPECIES: ABC transporter substrate-binding protein [unclassified Crossiella]MCK2239006.1 ABC transporter substrate-binding protein [Crossiella sp. S99.2]MCK2251425.1 ABC transporter substrate-binding protein [Crossiella sp. S99.1]